MEANGNPIEASNTFLQAWNEASNDFEKFTAAFYVSRQQANTTDKLQWLETGLKHALNINDQSVMAAFPSLHQNIALCYEALRDSENAKKHRVLANSFTGKLFDQGPFYHGTKADLQIGDLLTPGNVSNYQSELVMNHIYFTALKNAAGLAAALAKGEGPERVYIIEPMGEFENDPNVTDKKFPGNPTRSYRTTAPLKIIGEEKDWVKQSPEDLQKWREKLAANKGEIIN